MGASFSSRNLIYWWAFLTSFIFLQSMARDLAKSFRDNRLFNPESFPFSLASGMTRWIDDRTAQLVKGFSFDPNAVVVKLGNALILDGFRVGVILSLIVLLVAIRYYIAAMISPRLYDDIIALIIFFFVYHLEAQILVAIKVPFGTQMAQDRATWVWFMGIVVLAIMLGGRAFNDSRVFWKGLFELFVVWLFLIPDAAAGAFAATLDSLANFGAALLIPSNISISVVWALIGFLLAAYRIYGTGGASDGDGGLLSRWRRGKAKS